MEFFLQNYLKENMYILLEAMIVFLNPTSESIGNVLFNNNHHNIR